MIIVVVLVPALREYVGGHSSGADVGTQRRCIHGARILNNTSRSDTTNRKHEVPTYEALRGGGGRDDRGACMYDDPNA